MDPLEAAKEAPAAPQTRPDVPEQPRQGGRFVKKEATPMSDPRPDESKAATPTSDPDAPKQYRVKNPGGKVFSWETFVTRLEEGTVVSELHYGGAPGIQRLRNMGLVLSPSNEVSMPLGEGDKTRVRFHLGYMATQLASSVSFGQQVPVQTRYLLERSLGDFPEEGIPKLLDLLCTMDKIQGILAGSAITRLSAESLKDLKIRQDEVGQLQALYAYWGNCIADWLGVPYYAYSQRYRSQSGVPAGNIPTRH